MGDVLDQSEIDALLASVGGDEDDDAGGEAAVATSGGGADEAAPGGGHGGGGGGGHGGGGGGGHSLPYRNPFEHASVSTYDFKRPERVSKDHIRALGSIHDGFARNFGATLSGFLRTIIEVRVVGVEQLTYSEFIHSLPNPTCFVILQAPPLEGQMCMEVSPLIVYPIIDRLLGGSKSDMFIPQRPLTAIEWRLMRRLINRALTHLSEVWRNLVEAKFQIVETESNPQLVHIVAPTEVVVFITFEIKMSQCAGTMSICIPFNTIESVLSKLTTQSWFGYRQKGATDLEVKRIHRNLTQVQGAADNAYLGQAKITVSELKALRGSAISSSSTSRPPAS
jgi:flagellar motor switch protein FliM